MLALGPWISAVSSVLPILLALLFSYGVLLFLDALDKSKSLKNKRFREQISHAIQKESLQFEDIEHIAESWSQDRKSVLSNLRIVLADAVSGENTELEKHCDAVRDLLKKHLLREPYAELPENISLQLARLVEIKPTSATVAQLAASLGELYSKNQRESQAQKKLAYWGFFIGVIGTLLTIYPMIKGG